MVIKDNLSWFQEYEKHDELKRSAMRAVAALMLIPGAGKIHIFIFAVRKLQNTERWGRKVCLGDKQGHQE